MGDRAVRVAMAALLLVALDFVELHGPDGQTVYVNASEISTLRAPTKADATHYFPKHIRCVVVTTNGKFVASLESCAAIRDRIAGEQ